MAEQTVSVLLLLPVARNGTSSPDRPVKAALVPAWCSFGFKSLFSALPPAVLAFSLCSLLLSCLAKFGLSQGCGGNTAALKEPAHADSESKGQISTKPRTEGKKGPNPWLRPASWSTDAWQRRAEIRREVWIPKRKTPFKYGGLYCGEGSGGREQGGGGGGGDSQLWIHMQFIVRNNTERLPYTFPWFFSVIRFLQL